MNRRKKKIVLLLTVATMIVGLLVGCGNSENKTSKSDTMTISEMLNAVIKDNDGEVLIYHGEYTRSDSSNSGLNKPVGKDMHIHGIWGGIRSYDGEKIKYKDENKKEETSTKLGDVAKGLELSDRDEGKAATLNVTTDETGNAVRLEALAVEGERCDYELIFGSFSRITIYDKTFMVFSTRVDWGNGEPPFVSYLIIEDTDSTKDKTIVYDSIGTDGVLVDEINIDSSRFYPLETSPAD